MSGNPLLDDWRRDQARRSGSAQKPSGNPLLDDWRQRQRSEAPEPTIEERIARKVVSTPLGQLILNTPTPLKPLAQALVGSAELDRRSRTGASVVDAATDEGLIDRAGSLLERGAVQMKRGIAGNLLGNEATRQALAPMAKAEIAGRTTEDEVEANPSLGNVAKYIAETGIESAPMMAAAAIPYVGIPITAAAQTGNIAEDRASANGRTNITLRDKVLAAPFGIGSAILDRTGLMGILEAPGKKAISRVARAAGREGLTEGVQSGIEYTGGHIGTDAGMNSAEMGRQMIFGAVGGAGMGAGIRGGMEVAGAGGRVVTSRVTGRPIPKGMREQAAETAAPLTPDDEASPLPSNLIAEGKAVVADADATSAASGILGSAGLPSVGQRVQIRYPDGRTQVGVMADAFTDPEFDNAPGVKIDLYGGGQLDEHVATLNDAGVTITRVAPNDLDEAVQQSIADANVFADRYAIEPSATPSPVQSGPPSPAPAQSGFKVVDGGQIKPVADARVVAQQVLPGVRVTSARRKAGAAGKAGSKSWHVKSGAAIDVAPVKGMTFDAFLQKFRDAGFSIIEGIDETSPETMRRTGATGPHWHVVLGTGGAPVATANSAAQAATGEQLTMTSEARTVAAEPDAPGRRPDLVSLPQIEPGADLRGEPIDKEWHRFTPESGTLGVPRAQMPQIAAEKRGAMVNFLNARGVSHRDETVAASSLKPTQAEFSADKVLKARDFTGGDRAILVSSDDHVIDGHHQWLAKRDAGEDVRVIRLGATAKELLDIVPEFPSATVDEGAAPAADQNPVNSPETVENPPQNGADQAAAPTAEPIWSISDTSNGKSIAVAGATGKQIAAVTQAVPQAKRLMRADGASVYPKQHEAAIRAALDAFDAGQGPGQGNWLTQWADEAAKERAAEAQTDAPPPPAAPAEEEAPPAAEEPAPKSPDADPDSAPEPQRDIDAEAKTIADEFDEAVDETAPVPVSTETMDRLRADPELKKAVRSELKRRREERDAAAPQAAPEPAQPDVSDTAQGAGSQDEAKTAKPATAPSDRIEDFGETLDGARKHYAAAYKDRMASAADVDISAEPLSKSWPDPDYQKLLADGTDPYVVATIRAMRDEVPNKPQKGWKLKGWVDTVKELRAYANALVDGTDGGAAVRTFLTNAEGRRIVADLQGRIDLYEALGHDKSLKGVSLRYHEYSLYRGEKFDPPLGLWSVEQKAKATAYSNWPRELATGKTREEAIDNFKAKLATLSEQPSPKLTKFDIYSRRGTPGFIVGKKIGKTYADLKTFDTAKEAREYVRENHDELVKMLESFKDVPDVRRPSNSPRVGENHRDGADVSPQQFAEAFGFRGVQFGNYVEDARRREDLNEAYDALMDMAGVLGVPPKALSLNGELGLAFGARGKGGKGAAAAHYEKGNVVINLTKRGGAGSLAHEWWHALDNYFSRSGGRGDSYMTGGSTAPIREAMAEAFRGVNTAIRQTAIKKRSESLDQRRSKPYWSTDIEMSARSFESYIIAKLADNEFTNDYLANIVSENAFAIEGGYPYPTAAEIPAIRAGFDALFQTVEANEADGRVALQSRLEDREPVASLTGDELGVDYRGPDDMPALRTAALSYYKRELLGTTVKMADGVPASFTGRGLRKSTSLKGDILLRLVPAIPSILEKGEITWSGPGDRPDISKRIEVAARVELGDRSYNVFVIVREHSDSRRRQYDLTFDNGYRDTSEGTEGRSSLIDGATSRETLGDPDKKSPSAELNLRLVESESNAGTDATVEAARADLQQRLADYGIADRVALTVGNAILPPRVAGEFVAEPGVGRFITVALDTSPDARFTLDHEAVHAARNMGLFLPAEWRSLEAAAHADRAMMGNVRKRYPHLNEEQQVEEAVADRFARWQGGDKERGFIQKAFERVRDVLRAVGEALRGNGFTTPQAVMRAMAGGEIGAREGGTPMVSPETDAPAQRYSVVDDKVAEKRVGAARAALTRLAGSGSPFAGKVADAMDRWRTAVQDRYLPLLRTQQRIEMQLGRPLTEAENPYLGEELLTGRVGAKLENLAENMVEPLFDTMQREGVSIEELESYLYARHAPERNARIAKINPEFKNGGGSGMSDIEAAAIINRIEKAGKTAALKRVAALVDGIRDYALQERIDGGLMSADEAKAWRETYENYVPLRGKGDAGTEGEADGIRINRSSGINVKGKESRAAFGRRSRADDILAYTLLQAEEAIVRAETNRVAQEFVNLARAAPDDRFWAVDKTTRKAVLNQSTGLVRYEDQTRIQPEDIPYTVTAKFDGEEHRVTMNRDNASARRLAVSMRNLTQQQYQLVTKYLGAINRFLSSVNTSYNPEFLVTNAFRDVQSAAINLSGEDVKGIVAGTLKDYRSAIVASMKGAFGKSDGDWGKWYREFTAEGGRVYFNQVDDLATLKGRIEKDFALSSAKASGPKMDMLTAKRGFNAVRDFVEAANSGVENAVRLAAYKNAREAGLSKARAASLAKNVTVNFNRRGELGPLINSAYLFFNASVQGTARMFTAMKSPRVHKILAGVVVGGFLIELMNAFMSGTDDDGEDFYDKISAGDKARNLIIMIPGGAGQHIKIPLPYGFNAFYAAGRGMGEIMRRGGDRWQETAGEFASAVADAFNPVGGTNSLLNFVMPTFLDPIADLRQNRDFADRPILPEQNPYEPPEPDAQRYFSSVSPHWKAVTDFLTSVTGGNDIEAGAIDISPETLEYLSGVVFGATGGFIDRGAGFFGKIATGEDVEANDVPFLRKAVGDKPGWYDKARYYERTAEVEQAVSQAKAYIDREDEPGLIDFAARKENLLSLRDTVKAADKEMRAIRKARRENDFLRELGKIDDDAWRENNDAIKEAETGVVAQFNTVWNATMFPKRDTWADAR